MQHYFVKDLRENTVFFEDEDIHHILHVMRFKNEDHVVALYSSKAYLVSLNIKDKDVTGSIIEELDIKENSLKLTIIHGMPKQDKFELALQKAVELGVSKYVPYLSDRCIIKIDEKDASKKLVRWNKIVKEASEQSERISLMEVESPHHKNEIKNFMSEVNLICDENYGRNQGLPLREILNQNKGKSISIIIGPEGGFSKEEFDYFHSLGFISVGLGKRILRSETAVIYVASCMSYVNEEE